MLTEMDNGTVQCSFIIDSPVRRFYMYPTNVAMLALNSIFCLTATVQNLPVIAAILRTRSLHTPSNVLLCSLAVTDLTAGCVVHPIFVAFKAQLLHDRFSCTLVLVKEGMIIYTGVLSMLTLLAISLERLIALRVHLRYSELVTIPRVLTVVFITWLSWGLVVCAWPLGLGIYIVSLVSVVIIMVIAIALAVVCAIIFRILRRHQKVIRDQTQLHAEEARTLSRSRKSAAAILYVVVLLFIFYSPCAYATIRFNITKDFSIAQNILWDVATTLALMNASVNPMLYYWKMGNIRRAVKRLLFVNQVELIHRGIDISTC
ncbi:adrenocorticotropic hormone receptor-like [Orbicella faveolata]|uniref:adrenocorticotropic hormone receptor-like n=1 Tax=Orbicella faveolata TaxID=48498 RepID=UPI0009E63008|nr:adrenocorticotropic hormone receptor-like [Orbicella faveolata]